MCNNVTEVLEFGTGRNKYLHVYKLSTASKIQSCSTDNLTLMDWEKLQAADSLQTVQDYAWNSG